jgi:hypothetical protein
LNNTGGCQDLVSQGFPVGKPDPQGDRHYHPQQDGPEREITVLTGEKKWKNSGLTHIYEIK